MTEDLENRFRRLESGSNAAPSLQLSTVRDLRVPDVRSISVVSTAIAARLTRALIAWHSPADPAVDHFEVWVANVTSNQNKPFMAVSVKDSPVSFNIVSDAAGTGLVYVVTVMRNGLRTDIRDAPSKPITVF